MTNQQKIDALTLQLVNDTGHTSNEKMMRFSYIAELVVKGLSVEEIRNSQAVRSLSIDIMPDYIEEKLMNHPCMVDQIDSESICKKCNGKMERVTYKDRNECVTCGHSCTKSNDTISVSATRQLVDFKLINTTLTMLTSNGVWVSPLSTKEKANLTLFYKMITTSSAFAHKAHKELKKLNQGGDKAGV